MMESMAIQAVLVLLFARGSQAYTHFDTTCAAPSASVNFVSSPSTRGTLNILWSCLFTIFACTWTIQHLNIPEQRNNLSEKMERRQRKFQFRQREPRFFPRRWYDVKEEARELWPDFVWGLRSISTNLKWMLFTVLAPEFILGKAIRDFVAVWKLQQEMEQYAIEDNVEWELSHGFLALMGGFRYLDSKLSRPQDRVTVSADDGATVEENRPGRQLPDIASKTDDQPPQQSPSRGKPEHQSSPDSPSNPIIDGQDLVNSYIVSGPDILYFRQNRAIQRLPEITVGEILDKGKSNLFVKLVAAAQVFWMAVQVIVRSAKGLSVSQLELMTTAFSLCAIITYLFLLQKPQGIQTPERPMKVKLDGERLPLQTDWVALQSIFVPTVGMEEVDVKRPPRARVPNDFFDADNIHFCLFGMALGGAIFGAIHVAGWNLSFPTSIDQKIWRISSILMTCLLPVACFPFLFVIILIEAKKDSTFKDFINRYLPGSWNLEAIFQGWGFVFGILYIIARLILLVETFRTLAFLPPDAFISTWASNIPNVS